MDKPTPSPAQLALALVVSKSKPKGMDLQDYICKLRGAIKARTRFQERQLDGIAFWRQAYETAESEQTGLQEKVHELEQKIESSHAGNSLQLERKRNRPIKGRETSRDIRRNEDAADHTVKGKGSSSLQELGLDIGQQSENYSRAFSSALFSLRQALKPTKPDNRDLKKRLQSVCEAASEMLSSLTTKICRPGRAKRAVQEAEMARNDMSRAATAFRASHGSLLQAVDKLPISDIGNACFDLAHLLQGVLGHIHTLVAFEVDVLSDADGCAFRDSIDPDKSRDALVLGMFQASRAMTSIASTFFETLDTSRPSHHQLFEAFSCIFLDHLGSSLSLVVFSSPASTKSNDLGVLPPRGLLDTSDEDPREAIRIAERESEHLVLVLRHLMHSLEKAKASKDPGSTMAPGDSNISLINGRSFENRVHKSLQATLLRAVFGDEDQAFLEAFRRPDMKNTDDGNTDRHDYGKLNQEGFLGEVWNILGWHMLTGSELVTP